jgi:hypothetical protein
MDLEKLKYPTGRYLYPGKLSAKNKKQWIEDISSFPGMLKQSISSLSKEQLEWRYRPDGWTIRQVVHHCADSHMNAQLRFKLALTEDNPTIKPYMESRWAELPDMQNGLEDSFKILEGMHKRWVTLLKSLTEQDLARTYVHPEHGKTFDLNFTIGMYAWHCRHHFGHVLQAIVHRGQFN